MKFSISRFSLIEGTHKIQSIVANRPAVPILANILIEASSENTLTLSATDLRISMQVTLEANVEEPGAISLTGRHFFRLIRELTSSQLEFSLQDEVTASIKAGDSTFRLKAVDKEEFPSLPMLEESPSSFTLSPDEIKKALSRTVCGAAKEDSRHVLNGVLLEMSEQGVTFTGTDGKKLCKASINVVSSAGVDQHYLIPLKSAEEIIKLMDKDEVQFTLFKDMVKLELPGTVFITKLLSGDYPDVSKVIPGPSQEPIEIHREELMTLLKQIALFTSEKSHSVQFSLKNNEISLSAGIHELGDGEVKMAIKYDKEPFDIAFNPYFFHEILRHLEDEIVHLHLSSPHSPAMITDSSSALFVLMPMRLMSMATA